MHPSIEDVQIDACTALSTLDLNKENAFHLVKDLNGHELIIEAMKNFPFDAFLQDCGCELLWRLTKWDELKNTIIKAGGVSVLVDAIVNHAGENENDSKWRIALIRLLWKDEFGSINIRDL